MKCSSWSADQTKNHLSTLFILTRRSNKEQSQPTAARRLFEFWRVPTLTDISRRCAGCRTAICCAGPLLSLLRPLAMLQIKYHSGPLPRPILKGDEQRAGGGPWGIPKKGPWTTIRGAEIPARARCQTKIEGHGAARAGGAPGASRKSGLAPLFGGGFGARYRPAPPRRCQTEIEDHEAAPWREPPGCPKKAALHRYSEGGGEDEILAHAGACCQTDIQGRQAPCWRGPPRRPEKAALGRYSGGRSPLYQRVS